MDIEFESRHMNKSVIHIGANKTGSTTLQRALFSRHSGLHYLGEDGAGYEVYGELLNSMIADDDLYYPADRCRDLFQQHLQQAAGKTFLYSSEDVMTSRIPRRCAERLKSLVPDARILLVIRNQLTAIPSFYVNHGAFLKPAPPSYYRRYVSFDDWMAFQMMFSKYGALASYYYDRLLTLYADMFGSENIHVLLFEEFLDDRKTFVERLCRVLELDDVGEAMTLIDGRHERPSITARLLAYNRFRTKFFWGVSFSGYIPFGKVIAGALQRFLDSGPRAKVELSLAWQRKISSLYAKDNLALAKLYKLPLEKYGYPMA